MLGKDATEEGGSAAPDCLAESRQLNDIDTNPEYSENAGSIHLNLGEGMIKPLVSFGKILAYYN